MNDFRKSIEIRKRLLSYFERVHDSTAVTTTIVGMAARLMYISEKTVENHRSNIIRKLNLPMERNALVFWAMKNIR